MGASRSRFHRDARCFRALPRQRLRGLGRRPLLLLADELARAGTQPVALGADDETLFSLPAPDLVLVRARLQAVGARALGLSSDQYPAACGRRRLFLRRLLEAL